MKMFRSKAFKANPLALNFEKTKQEKSAKHEGKSFLNLVDVDST